MADVDDIETDDPVAKIMAAAIRKVPAHARLYPSSTVPAILSALRRAGYEISEKVEPGS